MILCEWWNRGYWSETERETLPANRVTSYRPLSHVQHVLYMYMYMYMVERSVKCVECRGFESHPRQLIFSRKSDCLRCAVLLCLICLFDLACFFLSSFSSLIENMYSRKKQLIEMRTPP